MNKNERPFPLVIVVAIYFLVGFFSLLSIFKGELPDLLGLAFIAISYGLITQKSWSIIGLQIIAIIQGLIVLFAFLMMLLPGDGFASLSLLGFNFEISPIIFYLIITLFVGLQLYVAFAEETKKYVFNS